MQQVNFFKLLRDIRAYGRDGLTLQRRLFAFFLLFLVTVMSELLLIFFAAGIFAAGREESRMFLQNELQHIACSMEKDLGILSVQGTALSRRLAEQLERGLAREGLQPADLHASAGRLEPLLEGCFDVLGAALEKNKASAAFIVLDATVNPALAGSTSSRAGMFLKNMAPNAAYQSPSAIRYMRGPASIARARGMSLMPQWEMEFTIQEGDFFRTAMAAAQGGGGDISGLYYWSPRAVLPGDYIEAMLLSVPLLASDGTVLGVCGFEISGMLFKMQYTPDNAKFSRIFAMLSPLEGDRTDASRAMLAGSYTVTSAAIDGALSVREEKNGLAGFTGPDGAAYVGLYQPIRLYPTGAAHEGQTWMLGVLLPRQDLSAYMMAQNRRILLLLFSLFLLSAAAASVLSRKYIAPVADALRSIQSRDTAAYEKTNIQEIDDLLAFLAEQDKAAAPASCQMEGPQEASALFEAFVRSIQTLSPAERSVFNLYMEGYNAKAIAEILCLSINTIKTHNKRIYMKLNVSSRNELMVFVKMMKEREGADLPFGQ
ncbi:MAG: LuxR C-terminal-related transcriptional regulator [Candidatus Pelethousia sp.]|nr:LuxR C-terminal-related transcriptional regulator [Candidatus Pelethousia sp.]